MRIPNFAPYHTIIFTPPLSHAPSIIANSVSNMVDPGSIAFFARDLEFASSTQLAHQGQPVFSQEYVSDSGTS